MPGLRGTLKNAVSTGRLHTDTLEFPSKKSRGVLLEALSHVAVLRVAICDRHMFALDLRGDHFFTAKDLWTWEITI